MSCFTLVGINAGAAGPVDILGALEPFANDAAEPTDHQITFNALEYAIGDGAHITVIDVDMSFDDGGTWSTEPLIRQEFIGPGSGIIDLSRSCLNVTVTNAQRTTFQVRAQMTQSSTGPVWIQLSGVKTGADVDLGRTFA